MAILHFCLLLEFIWADLLADVSTPVQSSHGTEWQFKIFIVKAHIGRSNGRFTPSSAMHYGMYIMGCIWQPFWILQQKIGCFYF